jgi:hypothetical protein
MAEAMKRDGFSGPPIDVGLHEGKVLVVDDRHCIAASKLLATAKEYSMARQWHGTVSVALGVCEVTVAVDLRVLLSKLGDWSWMTSLVLDALDHLRMATQWRSER